MLKRHFKLIAYCLFIGVILSAIYLIFATPRYTASAAILINPSPLHATSANNGSLLVAGQAELLKSGALLQKAAEKAGIFDNLKNTGSATLLSSVKGELLGAKDNLQTSKRQSVRNARFQTFRKGVSARQVGNSAVIEVSYTSRNPKRAMNYANIIAAAYLDDELEAYHERILRSKAWLEQQSEATHHELRREGIVQAKETGGMVAPQKMVSLSDQQLSELNSSLVFARSEAAQSKAQYELVQAIIDKGPSEIATSDPLRNRMITKLRNEYIELSRHANRIKRTQGEEHKAYRNLSQQMTDIEAIIMDEYKRVAASYKNTYEVAQARADILTKELSHARGFSTMGAGSGQSVAAGNGGGAKQNLYALMLNNYNQHINSFIPQASARIITPATMPTEASWPKTSFILLLGLIIGGLVGIILAVMRKQLSDVAAKSKKPKGV